MTESDHVFSVTFDYFLVCERWILMEMVSKSPPEHHMILLGSQDGRNDLKQSIIFFNEWSFCSINHEND